ncbi:MAG: conjugal transfer protein TraG N-terminal domain-containing protein [Pseudomonadota bacterium]
MDIIYTYGGGEIIHKVFNGIAILTKSNSAYFTNVVYVSALIGGVWAAAKALPGGNLGFFASSWFIPSYLLLSLFLVPKASVNIVDAVDPTYRADRVDNVPLGLALVASVSSSFSRALTEQIEDIFITGYQNQSSVPSFAAKLISEARFVRISDPTLRKNVKDFARQCFRLPFVLTNINGLRREALETNDIIGFVEKNAHSWLGIYWEDPGGTIKFLSCKRACSRVKRAMAVEGKKSLGPLLSKIFGWSNDSSERKLSSSLKLMAQDIWVNIAKQTGSASRALEQQLLVNAYREARDDKKTEFGIERISPELLSYSSTRVTAQQNTGFLLKAAVAGSYMPMLQAVVFALLLVVFLVLLPLVFLPRGISFLCEWLKMVISVQLWPVFSAIINGIAHIAQQRASASVLTDVGGFSIATQTALADTAYNVSTWMSALQLSLPFLAWAFVSRSGIALSQLMSSFSSGFEGGAAKIGSETADGNITFDTQNFRNQSMGNVQYAQQQLGANTNYGSTHDDGKLAITTSVYGQQAANVRQDSLTTNMSSNDNIAASAAQSHTDAQTLARNQARSLSTSIADRAATTVSLIDNASKGYLAASDVTQATTADLQSRAEATQSMMQQYGKQHGVFAQTVSDMALRFNSASTIWGKGAQVLTGLDAGAGVNASASNQEQYNKFKNSDIGQRIAKNIGFISNYAEQHKGSITDTTGRQSIDHYSAASEKVKTGTEQLQRTYTHSENWAKVKSLAENQSFAAATNENPSWISYVAERAGLDRGSAVQLIEGGGAEVANYRADFVTARVGVMRGLVESADHVLSDKEIGNYLASVDTNVGTASVNEARDQVARAGLKSSADLQQTYQKLQDDFVYKKSEAVAEVAHSQDAHNQQWSEQSGQHTTEHEKSNIRRMAEKSGSDLYATWSGPGSTLINNLYSKEMVTDSGVMMRSSKPYQHSVESDGVEYKGEVVSKAYQNADKLNQPGGAVQIQPVPRQSNSEQVSDAGFSNLYTAFSSPSSNSAASLASSDVVTDTGFTMMTSGTGSYQYDFESRGGLVSNDPQSFGKLEQEVATQQRFEQHPKDSPEPGARHVEKARIVNTPDSSEPSTPINLVGASTVRSQITESNEYYDELNEGIGVKKGLSSSDHTKIQNHVEQKLQEKNQRKMTKSEKALTDLRNEDS